MIKKIISGGHCGAERAALDAAKKLAIPYSGWIPKGQVVEDGFLIENPDLHETDGTSHRESSQKNVVDADGTLIITYGILDEKSKIAIDFADKNTRPYLVLDLNQTPIFKAAAILNEWIGTHKIEILNVTGSTADKNPVVYESTMNILESGYYLGLIGNEPSGITQTPKSRTQIPLAANPPQTVSNAVDRLIAELPLKDKITVANMSFGELNSLQTTLGRYLRDRYGLLAGNEELMVSCRFVAKKDKLNESEASAIIIEKLWDQLRKTHKLRVIK